MYRVLSSNQTIGLSDCKDFYIFTDISGDRHVRMESGQSRPVLTTSAIRTDPIQLVDQFGRQSGWVIVTRHSIYVLVKIPEEKKAVRNEQECLKQMLLQLAESL